MHFKTLWKTGSHSQQKNIPPSFGLFAMILKLSPFYLINNVTYKIPMFHLWVDSRDKTQHWVKKKKKKNGWKDKILNKAARMRFETAELIRKMYNSKRLWSLQVPVQNDSTFVQSQVARKNRQEQIRRLLLDVKKR